MKETQAGLRRALELVKELETEVRDPNAAGWFTRMKALLYQELDR